MFQFKRPELEDQNIIEYYLSLQTSRSCEATFANTYLWSRHFKVDYAVVEDTLVFRSLRKEPSFAFPVGRTNALKPALDALMADCAEQGIEFRMHSITAARFAVLEELYPGQFQIEYNREDADYVYEAEKLALLSGKKYHGKKNHINKFKKLYPDWSYEPLQKDNLEECFQMAMKWRDINGCNEDEEKNMEMCVTLNFLRLFEELKVCGGLLRAGGKIVAFTIGEAVSDDTLVVHVEKAFANVPGAYPMINQQFVLHEAQNYTYVNREEDMGEEGLRRAKTSYHPIFLIEKGRVTRK